MIEEEIAGSIAYRNHSFGANISCIKTAEGLVFADCGFGTKHASEFRRSMESKHRAATSGLFLTHGHVDHVFAVGAFSDVRIIAAEPALRRFRAYLGTEFTHEIIGNLNQVFPGIRDVFSETRLTTPTDWVETEFRFNKNLSFHVVGGHSNCSGYLLCKDESTIIAGDLLQNGQYPYFGDPETDLAKWVQVLKSWEKLGIQNFIPGHGRAAGVELVTDTRSYFEDLISTISELKRNHVPKESVASHADIPIPKWAKGLPKPIWYEQCILSLFDKL